ncbi:uncharacterized protein LOC126195655 [Schistocerca nitens]|uniref:uncharacterized protein LOC126195655 n=1 Tax=Schistocerca nitens TaxID=7011 RepID=UPI00211832E4|nr:uncharacterized protein LOC126195655 [Schistocerca nitens]
MHTLVETARSMISGPENEDIEKDFTPYICITISILSKYQSRASLDLWNALKRVLRYIKGTLKLSLLYARNEKCTDPITGSVDSDCSGDRVYRKSTRGYLFKVQDCSVSWASKKQRTVSLSSTQSEFVALNLATSKAFWLNNL